MDSMSLLPVISPTWRSPALKRIATSDTLGTSITHLKFVCAVLLTVTSECLPSTATSTVALPVRPVIVTRTWLSEAARTS
jgi:hypothetical protein